MYFFVQPPLEIFTAGENATFNYDRLVLVERTAYFELIGKYKTSKKFPLYFYTNLFTYVMKCDDEEKNVNQNKCMKIRYFSSKIYTLFTRVSYRFLNNVSLFFIPARTLLDTDE